MSLGTVSPLRQRMIEDMTIRQLGAKTQTGYVRVVRDFAAFLGRSPDQAVPEDLRRYQVHLASRGASRAKMNARSRRWSSSSRSRSIGPRSATGSPPCARPSGCRWC